MMEEQAEWTHNDRYCCDAKRGWKQGEKSYVGVHDVLGNFAKFAVEQSPYTMPDNLELAIEKLSNLLIEGPFADIEIGYVNWTYEELKDWLISAWEKIDEVQAWNKPKVGDHEIVFVDRYSQPEPDHDFIDLWALANNVARVTMIESLETKHF